MGKPAETAFRLITLKGRLDLVLKRASKDATVTPGKPWAPGDADPTTVPVVCGPIPGLVLDIGSAPREMSQNLAPESTAVALVPALALPVGEKPRNGDLLETGGDRYAVLRVDTLQPAADKIIYTLSLKAK